MEKFEPLRQVKKNVNKTKIPVPYRSMYPTKNSYSIFTKENLKMDAQLALT